MNNRKINNVWAKATLAIVIALLAQLPAIAAEVETTEVVYVDEPQQTPEAAPQTSQAHTREYYQKRWLEQNSRPAPAQPAMQHQPQNQSNKQAAPEADELFAAAMNGNTGQIGYLLDQGLDINVSNNERETALHMAASRGHYSTVIYLVNKGAYVNARTVKNWIALHHAVRFRHPNIANYLLQHGSSAGLRTSDGLSAVDMAKNVNDNRLLSILGAR